MKRLLVLLVLLLTLLVGKPALSADFQKGLDAYNKKDYAAALREWTLLAVQGDAKTQSVLGWMYRKGLGLPQNHKAGVKWFILAAKQGNIYAQSNLGAIYDKGRGGLQDYVRDHMWFNIAASQGGKTTTENRDIVAKRMTPSQLEKAQDLARECVKKNYKGY